MKKMTFFGFGYKWALTMLALVTAFSLTSDKGLATGGVWDYTGRAGFPVIDPPNEDTVQVVFPQVLPDENYTIVIGGTKMNDIVGTNGTFDVFLDGNVLMPTQTNQGFTLAAEWTVYDAFTSAWFGSWTKRVAMLTAMGVPALPGEPHVDWRIIRS